MYYVWVKVLVTIFCLFFYNITRPWQPVFKVVWSGARAIASVLCTLKQYGVLWLSSQSWKGKCSASVQRRAAFQIGFVQVSVSTIATTTKLLTPKYTGIPYHTIQEEDFILGKKTERKRKKLLFLCPRSFSDLEKGKAFRFHCFFALILFSFVLKAVTEEAKSHTKITSAVIMRWGANE